VLPLGSPCKVSDPGTRNDPALLLTSMHVPEVGFMQNAPRVLHGGDSRNDKSRVREDWGSPVFAKESILRQSRTPLQMNDPLHRPPTGLLSDTIRLILCRGQHNGQHDDGSACAADCSCDQHLCHRWHSLRCSTAVHQVLHHSSFWVGGLGPLLIMGTSMKTCGECH
jgi:hypothetical protein